MLAKVLKVFNFKGRFRQIDLRFCHGFFQSVPANTLTRLTGVRGEFYLQIYPHKKKLAHIKRFTHNIMTLIHHIKKLAHKKRFTHNIMTLIHHIKKWADHIIRNMHNIMVQCVVCEMLHHRCLAVRTLKRIEQDPNFCFKCSNC